MTSPAPKPTDMPGAQPNPNPQLQEPLSTGTPPAKTEAPAPALQATAPQTTPPAAPPATGDKPPEGSDWKEYARLWEQRAKDNQEAAKKWEEEQASKRTKEEQQAIELQQARERAEKAEQAVIRERVARETGVLPDFLVGGNEQEMRAAAQRLMEWRGPQDNSKPPPPQTAAVSASAVTSADKMGTAPNGVQQLTREQFVALDPAERMAAVRAGQCSDLGIGKPKEQRRMGNEVELGAHGART